MRQRRHPSEEAGQEQAERILQVHLEASLTWMWPSEMKDLRAALSVTTTTGAVTFRWVAMRRAHRTAPIMWLRACCMKLEPCARVLHPVRGQHSANIGAHELRADVQGPHS